jgi:transposase InsO family protein
MALRACGLVIASALALAGTAAGGTRALQIDRGVVQTMSPARLVLRELDGSVVTIAIGPRTRVRVNGLASAVAVIRPGFVATALHDGDTPAVAIRAIGRVVSRVDRGVVVSLVARRLTIRTAPGASLVFRVTPRTRIRLRGLPATVAALRPGRVVDVTHDAAGNAFRIALRPRLRG